MINLFKKVLYKVLGQANYLRALHISFFILYDTGLLRKNYVYKYHYFVKHLVQDGDVVIDMGANLGYYSKIFSRLVGSEGKVVCIEPVKPFFDTLKWAVNTRKNCILHNCALGDENKTIEMIIPRNDNYLRTGLARIPEVAYRKEDNYVFEIQMTKGSELLSKWPKIDYIKCDIEGYEEHVLPEIKEIIIQHKPILQVETWGSHKDVVMDLMQSLDYKPYGLYRHKLYRESSERKEVGDYLFIHSSAEEKILNDLKKTGLA